jgi:hypothetical protein
MPASFSPCAAAAAAFILGCASTAPPPKAVSTTELTNAITRTHATTTSTTTTSAELVRDDVIVRPSLEPDYAARAEVNAERVFASIHPDLLACYEARVRADPRAHAFMTFDLVVGPDGQVDDVQTTGGALLGERAMRCLIARVRRVAFEPPHGGGTLHLRVPLSMRNVVPGEGP